MYRGNAPDFRFQKSNLHQEVTVQSNLSENGMLLGLFFFLVYIVNNGSYLDILDNFSLPQLHSYSTPYLKVAVFSVYGECKMELWLIGFWQ